MLHFKKTSGVICDLPQNLIDLFEARDNIVAIYDALYEFAVTCFGLDTNHPAYQEHGELEFSADAIVYVLEYAETFIKLWADNGEQSERGIFEFSSISDEKSDIIDYGNAIALLAVFIENGYENDHDGDVNQSIKEFHELQSQLRERSIFWCDSQYEVDNTVREFLGTANLFQMHHTTGFTKAREYASLCPNVIFTIACADGRTLFPIEHVLLLQHATLQGKAVTIIEQGRDESDPSPLDNIIKDDHIALGNVNLFYGVNATNNFINYLTTNITQVLKDEGQLDEQGNLVDNYPIEDELD